MTKAMNESNAFRHTETGQLIDAVRELVAVSNTSITTASYTAISVPVGINCKSVLVKTRAGNNWLMATSASPSAYMTMDGAFEVAIAQAPGTVLFYAKAAVNDTLEVAFFD
ncbi:MAG: hypothetical protein WCQ69_09880 [Bacteroidales bacterium]|jgi:hypothetical protein|nr:hypothetical protein [Clostridiales bacterium]